MQCDLFYICVQTLNTISLTNLIVYFTYITNVVVGESCRLFTKHRRFIGLIPNACTTLLRLSMFDQYYYLISEQNVNSCYSNQNKHGNKCEPNIAMFAFLSKGK
jgi:hypothetical protein